MHELRVIRGVATLSTLTRQALRVYSALSELGGGQGDVLDALIPFFDPVLSAFDNKIFDHRLFATGVHRLYGWRFTGDIAEKFIPRLERKGILRKINQSGRDAAYIVRYQSQASGNETGITLIFEEIIDLFERFPVLVSDLLSYHKNRDDLKDILIRFLVSMDSQGQGAYSPEFGYLEPSGEAQSILEKLEEGGRPLDPNDRYICARFVRYLLRKHPKYTEHLVRLASIALLTEVVEDFIKPTTSEAKTSLTIIIDAPLALDYLGCSGHAHKEDISAILDSLRAIGARLIVFPITCLEMQRNLRGMLTLEPSLRHGYTHNALIKKETSIEYVRAVANNPEAALERLGITIRQISLNDNPYLHKYFTSEQYEDFLASVSWVEQLNAREHDATAAALTIRLREGRSAIDIFSNRYVMVTRNNAFVRHTRKYCLQSRIILEGQESPIVHQRELATIAWLRTGLGQNDAIPRGHLIASCDRVLQLRPEVRRALADQLKKVTSSRIDEFNLLMLDSRSVQKLTDETFNNENVVSAENAERLLDVIREATADEVREKYEDQIASDRAAAAAKISQHQIESEKAQEELAKAEKAAQLFESRSEKQLNGLVDNINKIANSVDFIARSVMIFICILAVYQYITGYLTDLTIWKVIISLVSLFSLYNLICNALGYDKVTLRSLINKIIVQRLRSQAHRLHLQDQLNFYDIETDRGQLKIVKKV